MVVFYEYRKICCNWLSVLQEDGDLEKATPEKLRLEEKQRIARRVRKEQGIEWQNLWFTEVHFHLNSFLSTFHWFIMFSGGSGKTVILWHESSL